METTDIQLDKELYLFELDNVLFDRADYILQVYYLFGSFYEFTEGTVSANDMAQFMKKVRQYHGEDKVFEAAQAMYGIADKYKENFERLQANAQIPLRLNLKPEMEQLLVRLDKADKKVAILTKGNPVEQLNKLRFLDWATAEAVKSKLKVYFQDELEFKGIESLAFIAEDLQVPKKQILHINN